MRFMTIVIHYLNTGSLKGSIGLGDDVKMVGNDMRIGKQFFN